MLAKAVLFPSTVILVSEVQNSNALSAMILVLTWISQEVISVFLALISAR